jgi:hypothetical protein
MKDKKNLKRPRSTLCRGVLFSQQGFNTTFFSIWISSANTVPAGDLIAPPLLASMRARRSF